MRQKQNLGLVASVVSMVAQVAAIRELTAFVPFFTGVSASMFSDTRQNFMGSLH